MGNEACTNQTLPKRSGYVAVTSWPSVASASSGISSAALIQIRWQSSDLSILETHPLTPGLRFVSTTSAPPGELGGTSSPNSDDSGGLSTGAKAGIGAGIGAAALLFLIAVIIFIRRHRSTRLNQPAEIHLEVCGTDTSGTGVKPAEKANVAYSPIHEVIVLVLINPNYVKFILTNEPTYRSTQTQGRTANPRSYPSHHPATRLHGTTQQGTHPFSTTRRHIRNFPRLAALRPLKRLQNWKRYRLDERFWTFSVRGFCSCSRLRRRRPSLMSGSHSWKSGDRDEYLPI